MAKRYIKEVQTIQPQGPYHLLGYSFGGIVAYEMACQLKEQGEQAALVAILDAYALSRWNALKQLWRPKNLIKFALNMPLWLIDQGYMQLSKQKVEIPPENRRALRAHSKSLLKYYPRKYDGKVTLFRVRTFSLLRSFDPELGWEALAKAGVETHVIPGSHSNLLDDPHIEKLAERLKSCLDL
jgi:aspartate racemase